MNTIKIYLKGWADRQLYNTAVNDSTHPLHAEAWAAHGVSFQSYKAGEAIYLATTYTDADADDLVHCERAFERFNVGDMITDDVVRQYRSAGHRSLSVGDVVVVDDRAYGCGSIGWFRIERFTD